MLDLLKLLGGFAVGLFRLQAAREAEKAFLRQQLLVLKRSAPARLRLRIADRLIFVWLYRLFRRCSELRSCSSPDAATLASEWLSPVLALEVRSPRRPAGDPGRDPQSRPGRQPRQPALGCATHSWRVPKTRYRYRPINRRRYILRVTARPLRAGGPSCAVTLPTSQPLICLSFRPSGSSFCTGWSSCV